MSHFTVANQLQPGVRSKTVTECRIVKKIDVKFSQMQLKETTL